MTNLGLWAREIEGKQLFADYSVLRDWFRGRASENDELESSALITIWPGTGARLRPWIDRLRDDGFAVFRKPAVQGHSELDDESLDWLREQAAVERLASVVLVCVEGPAIVREVRELVNRGIGVCIVGFRQERLAWAASIPGTEVVDVEEIPGFIHFEHRMHDDEWEQDTGWSQPTDEDR